MTTELYEEKREEIVDALHNTALIVNFTKKDGKNRDMLCTLQKDRLPLREVKNDTSTAPVNEEIVKVFDLEADAWRSFRVDSVNSIVVSDK